MRSLCAIYEKYIKGLDLTFFLPDLLDYHFYFPPENVITPSTLDELVNVIQAANDAGRKVRVVGSGHSMSPLAVSAGTLLSLINYRGSPFFLCFPQSL